MPVECLLIELYVWDLFQIRQLFLTKEFRHFGPLFFTHKIKALFSQLQKKDIFDQPELFCCEIKFCIREVAVLFSSSSTTWEVHSLECLD